MARDRGGPKIDMQVLINPAPDLTYGSERKNDPFDSIRWQTKMYLYCAHSSCMGAVYLIRMMLPTAMSRLYTENDSKEFSLKFIL